MSARPTSDLAAATCAGDPEAWSRWRVRGGSTVVRATKLVLHYRDAVVGRPGDVIYQCEGGPLTVMASARFAEMFEAAP